MRIGLDVRALQTGGGSENRGIGRYVAALLEGLADHEPEAQPVLLGLAGRDLPGDWGRRFETFAVGGRVYERASFPLYMRLPKVRSSQALLGRLHAQAAASQRKAFGEAVVGARLDVLHLPTAVDVGSFPAGDFPVPTVATFLDAIPMLRREAFYDTWAPFLQKFYDAQIADLRKAARVVAISEASRADAIRLAGLPPERVAVVYPAVSPAYGVPVSEETRSEVEARYGLTRPYALFCSVPDPHKNPERVVEAFARAEVENATIVFVSPRERPILERLRAYAEAYGLPSDRLVVIGRVPESDLVALFQGAACLVSPSLVEGFGLPAAQALAAGTPAIVSSRGSQPEVVGDAGLVVDPEDVAAIAGAIRRSMTDSALRAELAQKGRIRATRFAPERQAREMMAVYRDAVR